MLQIDAQYEWVWIEEMLNVLHSILSGYQK